MKLCNRTKCIDGKVPVEDGEGLAWCSECKRIREASEPVTARELLSDEQIANLAIVQGNTLRLK